MAANKLGFFKFSFKSDVNSIRLHVAERRLNCVIEKQKSPEFNTNIPLTKLTVSRLTLFRPKNGPKNLNMKQSNSNRFSRNLILTFLTKKFY